MPRFEQPGKSCVWMSEMVIICLSQQSIKIFLFFILEMLPFQYSVLLQKEFVLMNHHSLKKAVSMQNTQPAVLLLPQIAFFQGPIWFLQKSVEKKSDFHECWSGLGSYCCTLPVRTALLKLRQQLDFKSHKQEENPSIFRIMADKFKI